MFSLVQTLILSTLVFPKTVRGPVLFLLYINDITNNLGNLSRLFIDGNSLSYSGRIYDIMKSDINNELSKLVDFNPKKTKALAMSTSAVPHLDLRLNGEPVEIVKHHKHLGLTFASDGNWTNHIDNIVNAAFKQVNVLRKLKFTLLGVLNEICKWRNSLL